MTESSPIIILSTINCLNPLVQRIAIATGNVIKALTNNIPTTLIDAEITIATTTINKNWIHFGIPITLLYSSSKDKINNSFVK